MKCNKAPFSVTVKALLSPALTTAMSIALTFLFSSMAHAANRDLSIETCDVSYAGTGGTIRLTGCFDGNYFSHYFTDPIGRNQTVTVSAESWGDENGNYNQYCDFDSFEVVNFSTDGICIDSISITKDSYTLTLERFVDGCNMVDNEGSQTSSEAFRASGESYAFWLDRDSENQVYLVPPHHVVKDWPNVAKDYYADNKVVVVEAFVDSVGNNSTGLSKCMLNAN